MEFTKDGEDPLEDDVLLNQTRDEPDPALIHQHDERRDPLDEAIIKEHVLIAEDPDDATVRDDLVELVIERVQTEEQAV
jgi:hypothetical protein